MRPLSPKCELPHFPLFFKELGRLASILLRSSQDSGLGHLDCRKCYIHLMAGLPPEQAVKASLAYLLGSGIIDPWSWCSECFSFSNVFAILSVKPALEAPPISRVFDYHMDSLLDTFILWLETPLRMVRFCKLQANIKFFSVLSISAPNCQGISPPQLPKVLTLPLSTTPDLLSHTFEYNTKIWSINDRA